MDGDTVRQREGSHGQRLHRGKRLRPDEEFAAVHALDEYACKRSEDEGWDLACKTDDTEKQC